MGILLAIVPEDFLELPIGGALRATLEVLV